MRVRCAIGARAAAPASIAARPLSPWGAWAAEPAVARPATTAPARAVTIPFFMAHLFTGPGLQKSSWTASSCSSRSCWFTEQFRLDQGDQEGHSRQIAEDAHDVHS